MSHNTNLNRIRIETAPDSFDFTTSILQVALKHVAH